MGHCLPGSSTVGVHGRRRSSRTKGEASAAVATSIGRKRGGGRNNKYTIIIAIQIYDIADTKQRGSNAVLGDLLGAGIYPVMIHQYRLITGPMIWWGKVPCRRCRGHPTNIRGGVYPC